MQTRLGRQCLGRVLYDLMHCYAPNSEQERVCRDFSRPKTPLTHQLYTLISQFSPHQLSPFILLLISSKTLIRIHKSGDCPLIRLNRLAQSRIRILVGSLLAVIAEHSSQILRLRHHPEFFHLCVAVRALFC